MGLRRVPWHLSYRPPGPVPLQTPFQVRAAACSRPGSATFGWFAELGGLGATLGTGSRELGHRNLHRCALERGMRAGESAHILGG